MTPYNCYIFMVKSDRKIIEANEIEFMDKHFDSAAYNPAGNKLRLKRMISSLQYLSKKKRFTSVLSIGCGDGEFEFLFSPYAEHITAVDLSSIAIEKANKKKAELGINNIEFKCQSFFDIEWDKQYDTIICIAFLHHVPEKDLTDFLKQAYKHLKPGGFFFSQDPNINGIMRKIGRLILKDKYDKYHSADERELDPNDMTDVFKQVGFTNIKIDHLDLTLIPGNYMFIKGMSWLMYIFLITDYLWSISPFKSLSSGFSLLARRD